MSKSNETTNTSDDTAPVKLLTKFEGLGMFASADVKPDTIGLPDGKRAEFYVRELPDAEFRRLFEDGDRANLIAVTICDSAGVPVMTKEQASQLKPLVAAAFQDVAMKHAGFGKKAAEAAAEAGNG